VHHLNFSGHGWVRPCRECDGTGRVPRKAYASANDPDNWLINCDACDGDGHFPCLTCGNHEPHPDYDCSVCDVENARPAESCVPAGGAV